MIKTLVIIFFLSAAIPVDLIEIRQLFYASYENKASADKFLNIMQSCRHENKPVYVAYKGMAHLMQARFSKNPYTKVTGFNRGKGLLNKAVAMDPAHVEIRFLRFCIQTSVPAFLGYNANIQSDKEIVLKGWKHSKDKDLKARIKRFMIKSNYCNSNERRIFE